MVDIRFVKQGYEIWGIYWHEGYTEPHDFIATVARTCYKSTPKTSDANERLVRSLIKNGHDAMLEHSFLSVQFLTDRAIANELVRHRHFSFAQESTRYVNSAKRGFEFIIPQATDTEEASNIRDACEQSAALYEYMVSEHGTKPEIARAVLPLCTATTIVCSGNFREWRHALKLRTAKDAHPQMRALMTPLLIELREQIPIVFDDIEVTDA